MAIKFENKMTKELATVFILCKQDSDFTNCTVYTDAHGNYFVCTTKDFQEKFKVYNYGR